MDSPDRDIARREFVRWIAASPVLGSLALSGCASFGREENHYVPRNAERARNLFDLEAAAERALPHDAFAYLAGGADDLRTVRRNHEAYAELQIRPRRLIDVREIDTTCKILGETLSTPILLAPVGLQRFFHPDGELATARAAADRDHRMMVSSVANTSVGDIAREGGRKVWFQLYPTSNRRISEGAHPTRGESGL